MIVRLFSGLACPGHRNHALLKLLLLDGFSSVDSIAVLAGGMLPACRFASEPVVPN